MRRLITLGLFLLATLPVVAQTLTFPALSTDNTFTGLNTFNGVVAFGAATPWSFSSNSVSNAALGELFAGVTCPTGQDYQPFSKSCAAHLPLSGGTLTGPLAGTSASFSSGVTASLTGHASLDLPLSGGTLTGPLAGTSASFSSLKANVNGVINVMAPPYNAKCDGTTDDSTSLQTAINVAQASSALSPGLIEIPAGASCAFSTGLVVNGFVAFIGMAPSVSDAPSGSNLIYTGSGIGILVQHVNPANYTYVFNFRNLGFTASGNATSMIDLHGINGPSEISDSIFNGNWTATNAITYDTPSAGLQTVLRNNFFSAFVGREVVVSAYDNMEIVDNQFFASTVAGLYLSNPGTIEVHGNYFELMPVAIEVANGQENHFKLNIHDNKMKNSYSPGASPNFISGRSNTTAQRCLLVKSTSNSLPFYGAAAFKHNDCNLALDSLAQGIASYGIEFSTASNSFYVLQNWELDNNSIAGTATAGIANDNLAVTVSLRDNTAITDWTPGASIPVSLALTSGVGTFNYIVTSGPNNNGNFNSQINVKASPYNAKGDGVTNDTTAIRAAAAALDAQGGGELLFPAGTYLTTGNITLADADWVVGQGNCSFDIAQCASVINLNSTTENALVFTGKVGGARHIALVNTAATTPTAGSGILTNSAYVGSTISFDDIYVSGFYDDADLWVGADWHLTNSTFLNPVRFGVYIQNILNGDAGDWTVSNVYFSSGNRTVSASSAGLFQSSSGGGKVVNLKANNYGTGKFTHGIQLALSSSGQSLFSNIDIENTAGVPIQVDQGWPYMTFTNLYLNAPSGFRCIEFDGPTMNQLYIGGGNCQTNADYGIYFAVQPQLTTIMPMTWNAPSVAPVNLVSRPASNYYNNALFDSNNFNGASVIATDSNNSYTSGQIKAVSTNTGGGVAGIDLQMTDGTTLYHGRLVCSFGGGDCRIILPRNLAGSGFSVWDSTNTNKAFQIDSSTADMYNAGSYVQDAGHSVTTSFIAGLSTPTLAAGTGAGTGRAIACATTCDSLQGDVHLTTGTSPSAASIAVITFPIGRAVQMNCLVGLSSPTGQVTTFTWSETASVLSLNATTALTASTSYFIHYVCGGK